MSHSHVLYYDVLMWDQPVHAVVTPLPPVLRGSQVEQQRGPLLKGKFPGTSAHVVKFRNGLDLLQFCMATVTENLLHSWLLPGVGRSLELGYSPSSLVLGPLSTSSRVPGSLWGLSLDGGEAEFRKTKWLPPLAGKQTSTPSKGHIKSSFSILTSTPRRQPCTFHKRDLPTHAGWERSTHGG